MADPELRLELLGRQLTLAEAREEEDDILRQPGYPQLRIKFSCFSPQQGSRVSRPCCISPEH
ncbi:hypothetical protein GJ744_011575 [Endocarpon pusillum]|uniref:Uncharacterized protein n=1 Tax=Endocarpon pusillum TaxID=364733 RepID=A0A8H7ACL8_9EURO|nr:hypothetical protein GJ744_011575 [Endocarpon pusillum]